MNFNIIMTSLIFKVAYNANQRMNKILISNTQKEQIDANTYTISYQEAIRMLAILRSDHFRQITLEHVDKVDEKHLKFLIQITRLLKSDGFVVLKGENNQVLTTLLQKLNLHPGESNNQDQIFFKTKQDFKVEPKVEKLSIGFKSNETQQQIDENDLLKGQDIDITKKKAENCETKPRACANCNCGRKQTEKPVAKQELIKSINEGQPVSGCGKCFLGDSFRCGTCPYKGLPAFKPGDKLKLVEEGGIIVENAATIVSATGKVKLQL